MPLPPGDQVRYIGPSEGVTMVISLARAGLLAAVVCSLPLDNMAEAQQAPPSSTPPVLVIYREEVKPGRAAAHAANETAWAQGFAKAGVPQHWLGMTSMAGPTEAWFMSGYASYADLQKSEDAVEGTPAMQAIADKFSSLESDLLNRTTAIVATYRPGLSYQPDVSLPAMRFMQVSVVRVKPGHDREFRAAWRMQVEAHTKAKMDEHWAVYESAAGVADLTFFFIYPMKTLAEVDTSGPMHGADGFRTAVGEAGREQMREATRAAVESEHNYIFRVRPSMSTLPKEWVDADPTFWTVKAPEATAVTAAKKK
jgi:hypothetical protein